VDSPVVKRFEKFQQIVNERAQIRGAEKVEPSDTTDEFYDGLTSELMNEPM
jgi:hypothetical protein